MFLLVKKTIGVVIFFVILSLLLGLALTIVNVMLLTAAQRRLLQN